VEVVRHDLIVVGTGCAGLRAALEASRIPELNVVCISKDHGLYAGGIGSAGGVAAPVDELDADVHAAETVRAGDYLGDQSLVEAVAAEALGELRDIGRLGCPWTCDADGAPRKRRLGGMSRARAWFVRDRTGAQVRRALFYAAWSRPSIQWLHEYVVTKLLVESGRVCGVAALNLRTGQLKSVLARAVVLATGGASQVYSFATGGAGETGDGWALAYRAGAALADVEFVQFHPTGLLPLGAAVTEALRSEGGRLVNASGERFLAEDLAPVAGEIGRRDRVSRAMQGEIVAQRGVTTPHGPAVCLDLRELDTARLAADMPAYCALADRYGTGSRPRAVVHVRPSAHGASGGIAANLDGGTSLPGLFVAGDVAAGMHGATALAGNSLGVALVRGRRAGRAAARHSVDSQDLRSTVIVDQATAEAVRIERLRARRPEESVVKLRRALQVSMQQGCGLFRDARGLRACLREIAALNERYARVGLADRSEVFNLELARALELRNLLDVAEVIVAAALERTESRGMHFRTDFRDRDDVRFLKNSHTRFHTSGPKVEFLPVELKRWVPEGVSG